MVPAQDESYLRAGLYDLLNGGFYAQLSYDS
jgi:hypothetical protein